MSAITGFSTEGPGAPGRGPRGLAGAAEGVQPPTTGRGAQRGGGLAGLGARRVGAGGSADPLRRLAPLARPPAGRCGPESCAGPARQRQRARPVPARAGPGAQVGLRDGAARGLRPAAPPSASHVNTGLRVCVPPPREARRSEGPRAPVSRVGQVVPAAPAAGRGPVGRPHDTRTASLLGTPPPPPAPPAGPPGPARTLHPRHQQGQTCGHSVWPAEGWAPLGGCEQMA